MQHMTSTILSASLLSLSLASSSSVPDFTQNYQSEDQLLRNSEPQNPNSPLSIDPIPHECTEDPPDWVPVARYNGFGAEMIREREPTVMTGGCDALLKDTSREFVPGRILPGSLFRGEDPLSS